MSTTWERELNQAEVQSVAGGTEWGDCPGRWIEYWKGRVKEIADQLDGMTKERDNYRLATTLYKLAARLKLEADQRKNMKPDGETSTNTASELEKALAALAIELPEKVHRDVCRIVRAREAELEAENTELFNQLREVVKGAEALARSEYAAIAKTKTSLRQQLVNEATKLETNPTSDDFTLRQFWSHKCLALADLADTMEDERESMMKALLAAQAGRDELKAECRRLSLTDEFLRGVRDVDTSGA